MGFLDNLIKKTVNQVTNAVEKGAKAVADGAVRNAVNNAFGSTGGSQPQQQTYSQPAPAQNTAPAAAENVDPMYYDDGRDVAVKLREVLAAEFPALSVRENVSPTTVGGTGRFMNYSFAVYAGGQPKLFIMITESSTYGRREFRWSREQAEKAGVPMINFRRSEPNSVPYITQRLHKYLG